MISLQKHWMLSTLILSLLVGCSSSKNTAKVQPESDVQNEQVANESSSEISPDKEINVVINERVKYTFTKRDTSWTGTATQFDTNDPATQKVVQIYELQPLNGWSDFEDMVEYLNIYTMPDQMTIEDRKAGGITSQSRSYKFTVFDGDTTRSYTYFNPEGESINHWQSQMIATFGSYIVSEMNMVEL